MTFPLSSLLIGRGFITARGRRKRVQSETARVSVCVLNRAMRTDMIKNSTTCVLQSVSLQSPVGELLLSGCEKGVHTITISMETAHSAVRCTDVELNAELQRCVLWLQSYFSSAHSVTSLTPPAIHHPLLHTDSFSARVLQMLQDRVSVGQTVSYRQLAEMAGNERAVRAVGGAMRRNPVPLLIPCHRVLCSSGAIGGFMGGKGTEIKRWLLQHENPDHLKTC